MDHCRIDDAGVSCTARQQTPPAMDRSCFHRCAGSLRRAAHETDTSPTKARSSHCVTVSSQQREGDLLACAHTHHVGFAHCMREVCAHVQYCLLVAAAAVTVRMTAETQRCAPARASDAIILAFAAAGNAARGDTLESTVVHGCIYVHAYMLIAVRIKLEILPSLCTSTLLA